LIDLKSLLIERLGLDVRERQVIKTFGGLRMVGAERLVVDLERLLKERFGLGVSTHALIKHR
jgi:hypothetical protein